MYTGRKEGVDSGSERAEMMTVNIVTVNDERGRGRVREYRR